MDDVHSSPSPFSSEEETPTAKATKAAQQKKSKKHTATGVQASHVKRSTEKTSKFKAASGSAKASTSKKGPSTSSAPAAQKSNQAKAPKKRKAGEARASTGARVAADGDGAKGEKGPPKKAKKRHTRKYFERKELEGLLANAAALCAAHVEQTQRQGGQSHPSTAIPTQPAGAMGSGSDRETDAESEASDTPYKPVLVEQLPLGVRPVRRWRRQPARLYTIGGSSFTVPMFAPDPPLIHLEKVRAPEPEAVSNSQTALANSLYDKLRHRLEVVSTILQEKFDIEVPGVRAALEPQPGEQVAMAQALVHPGTSMPAVTLVTPPQHLHQPMPPHQVAHLSPIHHPHHPHAHYLPEQQQQQHPHAMHFEYFHQPHMQGPMFGGQPMPPDNHHY